MSELVVLRQRIDSGLVREQTIDGRAFLVAPVVAVREGILHGRFSPSSEHGKVLAQWEDAPIPVWHPQVDGQYVSARKAEQAARSIGRFYNARVENNALKGELWLDRARAVEAGGDALMAVNLLEAGQPVDVSTAYFCDFVEEPGVFNSAAYTITERNMRPDHLALLPGGQGECSWKDGCGAPRVNEKDGTMDRAQVIDALRGNMGGDYLSYPYTTAVDGTIIFGEPVKITQTLEPVTSPATNHASVTGQKEGIEMDVKTKQPEEGCEDCPPEKTPAVAVNEGGEPVAVTPDAPAVPVEITELLSLLRDLGGAEGIKTALAQLSANQKTEHADLVATLTANSRCAFNEDDLAGMTSDQLRKLEVSLRPADYTGNGIARNQQASGEWTPYVFPEVK